MRTLLALSLLICILPVFAGEYLDGMYKSLFAFYNTEQPWTFDSYSAIYPDLPSLRLDDYALRWDSFVTNLDFSECDYWVDSISMKIRAGS